MPYYFQYIKLSSARSQRARRSWSLHPEQALWREAPKEQIPEWTTSTASAATAGSSQRARDDVSGSPRCSRSQTLLCHCAISSRSLAARKYQRSIGSQWRSGAIRSTTRSSDLSRPRRRRAHFAIDAAGASLAPDVDTELIDVRALAPRSLPARRRSSPRPAHCSTARATSLLRQCGAPTRMASAGWKRHCQECRASHFPRTDPVVIMLATVAVGIARPQPPAPGARFSCSRLRRAG